MPGPQDPRFEWVEITTWGGPEQWIRGGCNHLTPEPVISAWPDEQLVAWLCVDCDAQLPSYFRPDPRNHYADPFSDDEDHDVILPNDYSDGLMTS